MVDRTLAVEASINVAGTDYRVLAYALREALFEVGALSCEIVKDDEALPDPADVVGKDATLTLKLTDDSQKREYCGLVARAERAPAHDDVPHLHLHIVPKMWKLAKRADCRIFQKKSVVDIAKKVLTDGGVTDQEWKTTGTYKPRDYVTQYRETDLDFVMRICSEEGIYFWIHSKGGKDTAHFADDPKGVGPIEGTASLTFLHESGMEWSGDHVMHVEQSHRVRSDKVTFRDYDPEKPKLKLDATVESKDDGGHVLEVYNYPGRYTDKSEGERLAKVLLDSMQAERDVVRGECGNLALEPGKKFSIEGHPYAPLNQELLILAVDIEGTEDRMGQIEGLAGQAGAEFSYVCRFTAVPTKKTDYRPPRLPRTAVMPAMQTAMTTGPKGEEIHTDKGAHVKVQFHWDRLGKRDDNSSRWMRTSQLALGGSMLIPRMNWEVAVSFNEGDADNPYVMARLYNGMTPPPYALPEHKGRGSLQTNTTPGGGSVNEFHMSDEKGKEMFHMNASHDMTVDVKNNTTESVGNNSERKVGSNHKLSVTNSSSASVGGNQKLHVGGNQDIHVETFMVDQVGGNHTLKIGGSRTMMVGGDHKRDVAGNSTLKISGMMLDAVVGNVTDSTLANMEQTVGGALVEGTAGSRSYVVGGARNEKTTAIKIIAAKGGRGVTIGGSFNQKVGGAIINKVTGDKSETAGATYMEVAAGAHLVKADNVTYEADSALTLVMGASVLSLTPASVSVAGVSIKLDGDIVDEGALVAEN